MYFNLEGLSLQFFFTNNDKIKELEVKMLINHTFHFLVILKDFSHLNNFN